MQAPLLIMKSDGGRDERGHLRAPAGADRALRSRRGRGRARSAWARSAGFGDIISIDVGGTSADICLVRDGRPEVTKDGMVGPFPLKLPIVDIHTIGAGGGSIAAVTSAGRLTVGPRSAGAEPGPVCYGRGGSEPTVTDAHLVLGRIPAALLGGELPLDVAAARAAIAARIGRPLGLDVEEAAAGDRRDHRQRDGAGHPHRRRWGAATTRAASRWSPSAGAGPLHACRLAELLDIPTVVDPAAPRRALDLGAARHRHPRHVRADGGRRRRDGSPRRATQVAAAGGGVGASSSAGRGLARGRAGAARAAALRARAPTCATSTRASS